MSVSSRFPSIWASSRLAGTYTLHPCCIHTGPAQGCSRWLMTGQLIAFRMVPRIIRFVSCSGPLYKISYLSAPIHISALGAEAVRWGWFQIRVLDIELKRIFKAACGLFPVVTVSHKMASILLLRATLISSAPLPTVLLPHLSASKCTLIRAALVGGGGRKYYPPKYFFTYASLLTTCITTWKKKTE